ncbi:sugar nucleotide-binding protein [Streptomyces asoensis]|uniref:Sugar nucleotide-binding protein n=1 Tax=Streptomyces asoensis TaxID=249586 RepID=A0A6M4WE95_9ACTN|nr:sugar nucleotide-binding protein [Streptomyces asoensis]QJT06513.1 sugar nucleotide-binding protein [Streptomyces asoensis]
MIRQAAAAGRQTSATFASRPGPALPCPASDGVVWRPLDIRDPARVAAVIADVAPSAVITASSGADWAVTADGAVRVALAAAEQGCRLVHVFSDAVFSGARVRYDERCLPDPLTPYGAAKAAAETAVRLLMPAAAVARTSLIAGHGRSVHERTVHALADGTRDTVLFTDDIRCPVHVDDLAAALWEIALSGAAGMFHLAGPDALGRHDPGVLIARRDGLDGARLPAGRRAGSSRTRGRGRAVREQPPALSCPRPRGRHRRPGRAARLKAACVPDVRPTGRTGPGSHRRHGSRVKR